VTSSLPGIGDYLRRLAGWRAVLCAIVAGAIFALAFAPFDVFPTMLLGLGVLVLLLDGVAVRPKPMRHAAAVGWGFGFGQFAAGMHWIFYPFLVDPVDHAWQIPFVALLFPGGLALFAALSCATAMRFWPAGPSRIILFGACYAAGEWLRGHVLTGLPWNLPAYGWGASLGILQSASLIGAYGLTLLTVLLGASLAELCGKHIRLLLPVTFSLLFAALWLGGDIRLDALPTAFVPGVHLRLVQPNIPQDEKYLRRLVVRNWRTLIDLSERPALIPPNVIVWPEAAPPVLLQRSPEALADIARLTGPSRVLITGNQRVDNDATGKRRFFNSLYVFGHDGELVATYDKFHLVPFGEYLPLESLLSRLGITKIVGFPGSFSAGDGPHTVNIPGAPAAGPLICYEILFPSAVVGKPRPNWFVNVTDDSWFGPWAGPRQHLFAARVRAIEEGLPVARAANTGISAVIDPLGRTIATLELDQEGVVDSPLPVALASTIYARFGDLGFAVLLLVCVALSWVLVRVPE
jgi:apolipoprotein N-acyltransferase